MKQRACEIVCNILENNPCISSENIADVRKNVLEKKFVGVAGMTEKALVTLVGESFQEMRFLHQKLGIAFDKNVANREMWYISEWLKENRINDQLVQSHSVESLSRFLADEIYKYAEGAKKGVEIWGEFLNKAKGYSIK